MFATRKKGAPPLPLLHACIKLKTLKKKFHEPEYTFKSTLKIEHKKNRTFSNLFPLLYKVHVHELFPTINTIHAI